MLYLTDLTWQLFNAKLSIQYCLNNFAQISQNLNKNNQKIGKNMKIKCNKFWHVTITFPFKKSVKHFSNNHKQNLFIM